MAYNLYLKEWRKKRGLNQNDLADIIGVSQQTISDYENGAQVPNLDRLVQLAQALNISLDELVLYEKAHNEYSNELADMYYQSKKKSK